RSLSGYPEDLYEVWSQKGQGSVGRILHCQNRMGWQQTRQPGRFQLDLCHQVSMTFPTAATNLSLRSYSFTNRPKEAKAGEKRMTSPRSALPTAACTASVKEL